MRSEGRRKHMAVQRCTKAAVGPPCRHKLFAKPANSPRNRVYTLWLSSSKQSPSPCRDVFQRNESLKNESLERKKNKEQCVTYCGRDCWWAGTKADRANTRSNGGQVSPHRSPGCRALKMPRREERAAKRLQHRPAPSTRTTPPLAVERPQAKVTINTLEKFPLFFSLSLSLFTFIHASFFYSSRREIKNRGKERALTYRRTFSRILTRCKLEKRPPKHRTRRTTNYSRDLVYKSCVWPIFGVFSFCWLL